MVEIKKILFPIDLTQNSSRILPYVLSAAEKYSSSVYLLHVIEDFHSSGSEHVGNLSHDHLEKDRQKALEDAEKTMDRVCEEQLQSCPYFEKIIVSGNPTLEIVRIIDSEDIDLVVMGTHGRGGIGHLAMGSVAESVVKASPVPVLIIDPYQLKPQ
jgi:nucleotide-binding universal stress UspA family protein